MSEERGIRSTNASVLTLRWSRGETRKQTDKRTSLGLHLLNAALCLCLSLRHGVITLQALSEANRRLWMEAMDGKEPV